MGGVTQSAEGLIGDGVRAAHTLADSSVDAAQDLAGALVSTASNLAGDGINAVDDLVADSLDTATGLAGNISGSGNALVGTVAQTADGLLTTVGDAVGLDGGGLIGAVGSAVGGIGSATGLDGLVNGLAGAADGPLTGDVGASTGPNGTSPSIVASLTDDGGAGHLIGDAGNMVATDLAATGLTSDGPIASASLLPNGNAIVDDGATATLNDPSQPGALVAVDAASNGPNGSSQSLLDAEAGPQSQSPGVVANVFSDSADGSQSQTDSNIIDLGPNGHTLVDAEVATSPDQFQFTSLDGTGTDSLVGSLADGAGAPVADAGLVPAATPPIELGDQPVVDVAIGGDADSGQQQILTSLQPVPAA